MSNEYQGIEVFGRAPRRRSPRTPKRTARPLANGRLRRLGFAASIAGGVTVVLTAVGIGLSMFGHFGIGILLAYLSTGTSVVAVLCGATAVVTSRGRVWGGIAIVLGILASPPVLTRLLGWASGLG